MSTPRKTSDEMLNDSCIRGSTQPITAYEYDENHMMVFNENTNGEYIVDIDHECGVVYDCTCPHRVYRTSALNIPCKHMISAAIQLGYRY